VCGRILKGEVTTYVELKFHRRFEIQPYTSQHTTVTSFKNNRGQTGKHHSTLVIHEFVVIVVIFIVAKEETFVSVYLRPLKGPTNVKKIHAPWVKLYSDMFLPSLLLFIPELSLKLFSADANMLPINF
jgi:hypothetical protein